MEGAQARVQDGVNTMLNTLDKDRLRKMQADMYKCSAKCCEDQKRSLEEVQRCVEDCSLPVTKAQNLVQTELQNFQNRLQRCALDCQDKVRDKLKPGAPDTEVSKFKREMEDCVVLCANTHIDMLPNLLKRMKEVLAKGQ